MYTDTPIKEWSSDGKPTNTSRNFTENELAVDLYERFSYILYESMPRQNVPVWFK